MKVNIRVTTDITNEMVIPDVSIAFNEYSIDTETETFRKQATDMFYDFTNNLNSLAEKYRKAIV